MQHILNYPLIRIGEYSLTAANVMGMVLIWALAWLSLRLIRRLINRGLSRIDWDQGRRHSLFLIVQYLVWSLAAALTLENLGVHITVLVAGSAALLVGLGLGIQQIFQDIVSGIFLLFEGTIEVGDVLKLDGEILRVTEINLRTSKLENQDGAIIVVPNHKFIVEKVVNRSLFNDRPFSFTIRIYVHSDNDETTIRALLQAVAAEHAADLVETDSYRTEVRFANYCDNGDLSFDLVVWLREKFDSEPILSKLRFAIRQKMREQNIKFPVKG